MKLADITVGLAVSVRRGYSIRPAIIDGVHGGTVSVSFTDVDATDIPADRRSYLYGATVRPNQITARSC